jgi:hypothetical protein
MNFYVSVYVTTLKLSYGQSFEIVEYRNMKGPSVAQTIKLNCQVF